MAGKEFLKSGKSFTEKLTDVLMKLDDITYVTNWARGLGRSHKAMGIKKEWFIGGVQALMEGLKLFLVEKFDEEHKIAWWKVFSVLLPLVF